MKTLLGVLLSIPQTILGGIVFSFMWNWFIVRKFNVPSLNCLESVGVLMTTSFALISVHTAIAKISLKQDDPAVNPSPVFTSVAFMTIIYPGALLIAYFWHLAIG